MTQPAGWYYDAHGVVRYWDGSAWTDNIQPQGSVTELPRAAHPYMAPLPTASASHERRKRGSLFNHFWFWVTVAVVIIGAAIATVAAVGSTSTGTKGPGSSASVAALPEGVGPGGGGGVVIGVMGYDSFNDNPTVTMTILNESSVRADYDITIALESADQKHTYSTAELVVQGLEPHKTSSQTVGFLDFEGKRPANSMVYLVKYKRTDSH